MDSSIPPPPSAAVRKLRPWYLVPAMVLTWCVGVWGLMAGCSNVAFLRQGVLPDIATATRNAEGAGTPKEFFLLRAAAELDAVRRLERITFPLSVAQILLGALLVIASGMAMGSRRGARGLGIQALLANAMLAVLAYALTRTIRASTIEAVATAAQTLSPDLPLRATLSSREGLWWAARLRAAGELGMLTLGMLVLTRPRTKVYFEAVARAEESAEEP